MNGNSAFPSARFEQLFKLSPDAIFITNSQGVIEDANEVAETMFGYSPGELRGQPIESLVPERFPRQASWPSRRIQFPPSHALDGGGS